MNQIFVFQVTIIKKENHTIMHINPLFVMIQYLKIKDEKNYFP